MTGSRLKGNAGWSWSWTTRPAGSGHANLARPATDQERERLQARRLRAAELFALGVRQAEVARQIGVSSQAVSVWYARWQADGTDALPSRGPTGPAPKLSDTLLGQIEQAVELANPTGPAWPR